MAPINNSSKASAGRIAKNKSFSTGKSPKTQKQGMTNAYSSYKSGISPSKNTSVATAPSDKTNIKNREASKSVKSDTTSKTFGKTAVGVSSGKQLSALSSKQFSTAQSTPKSSKVKFGLIWIPLRKRNKHKNIVYNSHQGEETRKERRPSMYNIVPKVDAEAKLDNNNPSKKKDDLNQIEKDIAVVTVSSGAVSLSDTSTDSTLEELTNNSPDSKEKTGDTATTEEICYYPSENKDVYDKLKEVEEGKIGDNVDSVMLRLPPQKTRSNTPMAEDDDCCVQCLYYTIQCCDCSIM